MAQRGPLVTAVVVVGGLVGLMTANATGALVTAGPAPDPEQAAATQTAPPVTEEQPPAETTAPPPPAETTAPPLETTTEEQPPPEGGAVFPAEAVYEGAIPGTPTTVAVAVKGAEASAYLCDGAAVETWLKGTVEGGTVELASADGRSTLTAELQEDGSLDGTVTINGVTNDFSVTIAGPPAGLYRGENGETTVGWIILQNGTQVGVARSGSRTMPAPPLDPDKGSVTIGGKRVTAEKVTGETAFG
jgi:hypothetical protein